MLERGHADERAQGNQADEQDCEVCFQSVPTPAAHVDRATVLCARCALARLERRMRAVRAA